MKMNQIRNFLLAVTLIAGPTPVLASESEINQNIDQLLGDHTKYQAVIVALQKAVAANDAKSVAALIDYPIGVKINGKETHIKSAKAFEENYKGIITPSIAKAITHQKYEELFVNYKGVMFGDGQVWVNGVCHDNECKRFDVKVETIQDVTK